MKKGFRSGKNAPRQSWIELAIRCCFVVLIGIAFVNQQVLALSSAKKTSLENRYQSTSPTGPAFSAAGFKVTFPSDAETNDSEFTESDEYQSGKEEGNEYHESPIAASVEHRIAVLSLTSRLRLHLLATDPRTETSLFILYHSWKCFLC